jgi:hypothetical protein
VRIRRATTPLALGSLERPTLACALEHGVDLARVMLARVLGALSVPQASQAVPARRGYEIVGPPSRADYATKEVEAVTPDGESTVFESPRAFAAELGGRSSVGCLARCGGSGSTTTPLTPSASIVPETEDFDFGSTLETSPVKAFGSRASGANSSVPHTPVLRKSCVSPRPPGAAACVTPRVRNLTLGTPPKKARA